MTEKTDSEVAIADTYRCGYEAGQSISHRAVPDVVVKIIELIDNEMPEETLLVTVLGMLDVVKDHYMPAARGETE